MAKKYKITDKRILEVAQKIKDLRVIRAQKISLLTTN